MLVVKYCAVLIERDDIAIRQFLFTVFNGPAVGQMNVELRLTIAERGFGGKCFPKDLGAIIGRCREFGRWGCTGEAVNCSYDW